VAKLRFSLLAVLLLLLLLAACGGEAGEVKANLGQEFSLSIGQTASIQDEALKLKFLEVISDSRCPKDVTCVWQGQASCLVEITYLESLYKVTLVQPGLTEEPFRIDFNDYLIEFNLTPYPQAGKEIKKGDYQLQLVVTRPLLTSSGPPWADGGVPQM
jgi:hypothetical protein